MRRKPIVIAVIIALVLLDMVAFPYILIDRPDNVSGLKVTDKTYDSVAISWKESHAASKYVIYKAEKGKELTEVAETKKTDFKDKGLKTGTTYTYRVEAKNFLKKAKRKTGINFTPKLETPELAGSVKSGEMKLTISEVPGALGYKVFRNGKEVKDISMENEEKAVSEKEEVATRNSTSSEKDGSKTGTAGDKDTKKENKKDKSSESEDGSVTIKEGSIVFIDTDAKTDKKQVYKVKAYRGKAESEFSQEVEMKLVTVEKMSGKISDTDPSKAVISWDASDKYTSYKLYDKDDNLLTETSECEYTFPVKTGDYTFKLVGYKDKTKSPPRIQEFEIKQAPMNNEEARKAAIDWAVKIAADDSFTYGTKGPANHAGCYFCGTQGVKQRAAKKKGITRNFAKTYCCNPFVTAAYAHGAKDPYVLDRCKRGGTLSWLVGCNHIKYCGKARGYQNFKYLGHIPASELIPGDVLSSSGHAKMYIGNGKEVQATGGGWSASSIRVNSLSYGSGYKVFRYTGTGSGTVYRITEKKVKEDE